MAEPLLVKAIINRNLPNNKLFSDANVNQVDNQGQTPLYWASKYGSIEWVKSLLNKGAKINKAEKNGKTPLYVASEEGKKDVVKLLLNRGVNVTQAEKNGVMPLNVASNEEIKDLIIDEIIKRKNTLSETINNLIKKQDIPTLKKINKKILGSNVSDNNAIAKAEEISMKAKKVMKVAGNYKTKLQTKVATKAKEADELIKRIKKGNNITNIQSINLNKLGKDSDLKRVLQVLSVKGTTDEHKEMMKKLLKIWVERGRTVNSAKISKTSPFIINLKGDIKRITNNYALRKNFNKPSNNVTKSYLYNTPEAIKKALLTQNGRKGIISAYKLNIPNVSTIPEIVNDLHNKGSFKNSITLNSLKTEYQSLREAYSDKTNSNIYKNLNTAIASISLITNANIRAKINKVKDSIPSEMRSGNTKIGLVLKSNGSPYKLVNYTNIKKDIEKFKATGKSQNLNNNSIITNTANGTWTLVGVPKNLIK